MATIEKDLGAVSAYAIAVENGFQGTVEEWLESLIGPMGYQGWSVSAVRATTTGQLIFTVTNPETGETKELDPVQADTVDALREIEAALDDAKKQVKDTANSASESAVEAVEGAQNAGVEAVGDAKTAAVEAVTSAQTAGVQAVQGAQTTALNAISEAQTQAKEAVGTAEENAVNSVNSAGQTAVENAQTAITTAKNQAVTDVQNAGQSAVGAVEEAQITGVQAVETAQTGAVEAVEATKTSAIQSVQDAGTEAVETITQTGDQRYAPIESAIKVSGYSDGIVSLSPTIPWYLQDLKIYGKSTQDGTPSPENPIPIVSAGDSGSIDLTVIGKNLLDLDSMVYNGAFTDAVINDVSTLKSFVILVKGLSKLVVSRGNITGDYFCLVQSSYTGQIEKLTDIPVESFISGTYFNLSDASLKEVIIDKNANYLLCYFWSATSSYALDDILGALMVSENGGPYEPYTSQTLTLSTPNGLPGIPVESGGNYTDSTGQQWICDVVDFNTGKVYFPLKKYSTGDFTYTLNTPWTDSNSDYAFAYIRLIGSNPIGFALSNAFKSIGFTTNVKGISEPIIMVQVDSGYSVVYFSVLKSKLTEISNVGFDKYMSSIAAEFIAANTNPNEIFTISAEELVAYRTLTTYSGTTVVSTTEPVAGIEASALTDPTTIIKNLAERIAALESATTDL